MSIDDPVEAAEGILAAEERERSPIRGPLSRMAEFLPGRVAKALATCLKDNLEQKHGYMLQVIKQEMAHLRTRVDTLIAGSEEHRRFAEEEWPPLALDAFRKAEQTRSKDRIGRIGAILSHSLVKSPPMPADDVEDMMRVAMELSDREVLLLAEIDRLQGPAVTGDGRSTQLSKTTWAEARLQELGMTVEDVFSIGPKLQGFGLIRETEEFRRSVSVKPWPYALLPKGRRFLELAQRVGGDNAAQ